MASKEAAEQNMAQDPPAGATPEQSGPPREPPHGSQDPSEGGVQIIEPNSTSTEMPIKKGIDMTKRRPKRTKEERREAARLAKIERDKEEAERKIREEAERIERERKIAFFKLHDYHEEKMLFNLGKRLEPSDVSNLKIHIKIEEKKWDDVMGGDKFLEYLKSGDKTGDKMQDKTPDKLNAKFVAQSLHKLGKRKLSNEARWIQMVCGDGIPEDDAKPDYFFALIAETLKMDENKHLLNELRHETKSHTKDVGQLLLELVDDGFFQRDLIKFSCALDERRAFRWKDKLQNMFIKSFHFHYRTEEKFQANMKELAEGFAMKGTTRAEEKPQLMET